LAASVTSPDAGKLTAGKSSANVDRFACLPSTVDGWRDHPPTVSDRPSSRPTVRVVEDKAGSISTQLRGVPNLDVISRLIGEWEESVGRAPPETPSYW
jgi:hypothetical protein